MKFLIALLLWSSVLTSSQNSLPYFAEMLRNCQSDTQCEQLWEAAKTHHNMSDQKLEIQLDKIYQQQHQ
jgi:hypothetical protein